jgi:nucleotide-binding universal stress UspA family protein
LALKVLLTKWKVSEIRGPDRPFDRRRMAMKIGNILFPTDFSEASNSALPHTLSPARKFGSLVTSLHVGVPNAAEPSHPHYLFYNKDAYNEYVEDQLRQIIDSIGPDLNVSTFVSSEASPALNILNGTVKLMTGG